MTAVLWFLLLAPVGSWATAIILTRHALERPYIRFLSAVSAASLLGALGGTLLVPLAAARLAQVQIHPPLAVVLLVVAILIFSLPGPAFLALYFAGYFDADGDPPPSS